MSGVFRTRNHRRQGGGNSRSLVDPVLEAIALASFVDGLAVSDVVSKQGRNQTGKGCADSTVLGAQFWHCSPGARIGNEVAPDGLGRKPIPIRRASKA